MFIFGMQVYVQHGQVKFVYQGQSVEVTVTGAKKRICVSCSSVVCLRLKGSLALCTFLVLTVHTIRRSKGCLAMLPELTLFYP